MLTDADYESTLIKQKSQDDPDPKLSVKDKERWNKFIEFVAAKKMNNSPELDKRDKAVGYGLIDQYNKVNPNDAIDPAIVTKVQKELQDYRNASLEKWKSGKAVIEGVDKEEDFMPGLSQVDGWPGTKTLSNKFPGVKAMTVTTPTGTYKKEMGYGLDVDRYDRDMGFTSNKGKITEDVYKKLVKSTNK